MFKNSYLFNACRIADEGEDSTGFQSDEAAIICRRQGVYDGTTAIRRGVVVITPACCFDKFQVAAFIDCSLNDFSSESF